MGKGKKTKKRERENREVENMNENRAAFRRAFFEENGDLAQYRERATRFENKKKKKERERINNRFFDEDDYEWEDEYDD